MNSRERVFTSLRHQSPDRIPVDFGGTNTTGMHVSCVAALRDFYGLAKTPVTVHEPGQMLGWLDEDLKQIIGVDVESLFPPKVNFGFRNERWKTWRMPDGLEVLVAGDFNTTTDASGNIYMHPQGDLSAPPCARMPNDGYFFDAIIRQEPIVEDQLNPEDNLEEYGPVGDETLDYLEREIERAAATGRAIAASFGGTSLGDIARVPGPALKHPKGIRDIAEWYMSIATRPDYLHAVFSRQTELALQNLEKIARRVGDIEIVAYICGTDFGTQTGTFCSLKTFRALYKPYYQSVNDWIHQHTRWKTFKHCCGSVVKFLDDFIDCGFDIFNPVQCSAANMDPQHLKQTYGDRLTFWGGVVDTQKTLPFGTPAEVREEVLRRCEILSPHGGFVINSVHNVQARTPVTNIVAMIDAIHEFNGSA
jgi:hypothetical protein